MNETPDEVAAEIEAAADVIRINGLNKGDFWPVTDLGCLDCRTPLAEATHEMDDTYLLCRCGVRYSVELVEQADRTLWRRAQEGRLFRRSGANVWMTEPLEAIKEWP